MGREGRKFNLLQLQTPTQDLTALALRYASKSSINSKLNENLGYYSILHVVEYNNFRGHVKVYTTTLPTYAEVVSYSSFVLL